jgi:hypothetical protein
VSTDSPKAIRQCVFLESSDLAETRLRLRFIPICFDAEPKGPVLRIEVDLSAEIEKVKQKISSIAGGVIDDIEVDSGSLLIWVEGMEQPVDFVGSTTSRNENYSVSDYINEIKSINRHMADKQIEIVQLSQTIDQTLGFIDRTIDRIEKKQRLLSPKDKRYTKQIELLRGVRRQLADD